MTTQANATEIQKLTPGALAPHAREAQAPKAVAPATVRAKCGSCGLTLATYQPTDFPAQASAHGLTPEDVAALEPGAPAPHAREASPPRGPQCRGCGVRGRVRPLS